MSTVTERKLAPFKLSGAISKGQPVKMTSNNPATVTACSETTDRAIGLAQTAGVDGDTIEVAMPGGGGFGLADSGISMGNYLGINADGNLQKVANANDVVIAQAMENAVAGDVFECVVLNFQATQTQS